MSSKTKYFQNCLGVFQGGGCKGAAYVGAFKQCLERGVSFSEVVGASAGAIVAVFIAAGASPSQLEDIIRKMDFKKFLRAANDNLSDSSLPWYVNKSKWIIPKKYKSYHTIVSKLGIYESSYIEEFVNEH